MAEEQTVQFGSYRLDPANARLWHATQPVRLTPKAFQVLCYLAERPGQLVSKDELFQAVWTDTVVSEATLTSAIQEIRKALADNAREPQYVETMPKREFRFIATVTAAPEASSENEVQGQEIIVDKNDLFTNGQGVAANEQGLDVASYVPSPTEGLPLSAPKPYRFRWWQVLLLVILLVKI